MVKDFLISFSDNFKEKTKNPFLGTYLLVWEIRNWELIYTLFNFDSDCTLNDKKAFIFEYYKKNLVNIKMTTKTNELYRRLINHFIFFALAIIIVSCNTNLDKKTKQVTTDSLRANITTNDRNALKDINLVDTIRKLMNVSLSKDTFEYEAFYNENSPYLLLYFKTGNIFTSKKKHALTLYSINDTTVKCELRYLTDGKWNNVGSNVFMHIDHFSPAYFNVHFDDYNFDGNKDLNIIFYNSMGVVYSYGYILTFNESSNSLTLHPETIEIPSLEIVRKGKIITSTYYSNPSQTTEKYKILSSYRWTNDTLKLFSKKEYKLK